MNKLPPGPWKAVRNPDHGADARGITSVDDADGNPVVIARNARTVWIDERAVAAIEALPTLIAAMREAKNLVRNPPDPHAAWAVLRDALHLIDDPPAP